MATEVWMRNPDLYIRECVEIRAFNHAWDRGHLVKKHIDPSRFSDLWIPADAEYRLLCIGDQGTAEVRRGSTLQNPTAVYPTWDYSIDNALTLEELIAHPVGDDPRQTGDMTCPADERPVKGQEHRVVIIRVPPGHTGPAQKFYRMLRELQLEYPHCIVHVHSLYSFRIAFGLGFASADIDPRPLAKKGKVALPSGKEVLFEDAARTPQWVNLLGFRASELAIPRNRCMFNMKSAFWAAEHYSENYRFRSRGDSAVDDETTTPKIVETRSFRTGALKAAAGDKFLCDVCTLQDSCKYFRSGGVCSIPGTETATLAGLFQSRDPDQIIEGLGSLIAVNARRLEKGLADEADFGGKDGPLDPEVSRVLNAMVEHGAKLAKLIAPGRFTPGTKIMMPAAHIVANTPAPSSIAAIVADFEARGIPRHKITPEMLERVLDPSVIDVPALVEATADDE